MGTLSARLTVAIPSLSFLLAREPQQRSASGNSEIQTTLFCTHFKLYIRTRVINVSKAKHFS